MCQLTPPHAQGSTPCIPGERGRCKIAGHGWASLWLLGPTFGLGPGYKLLPFAATVAPSWALAAPHLTIRSRASQALLAAIASFRPTAAGPARPLRLPLIPPAACSWLTHSSPQSSIPPWQLPPCWAQNGSARASIWSRLSTTNNGSSFRVEGTQGGDLLTTHSQFSPVCPVTAKANSEAVRPRS